MTGGGDGDLRVWTGGDDQLVAVAEVPERAPVNCAVTLDGDRLLSGCDRGAVQVWELQQMELQADVDRVGAVAMVMEMELEGHDGPVLCMNVLPAAASLADDQAKAKQLSVVSKGKFQCFNGLFRMIGC